MQVKVIKCCISNRPYYIDVAPLPIDRHAKAALYFDEIIFASIMYFIIFQYMFYHCTILFERLEIYKQEIDLCFPPAAFDVMFSFSRGSRITLCFISHVIDSGVVAL